MFRILLSFSALFLVLAFLTACIHKEGPTPAEQVASLEGKLALFRDTVPDKWAIEGSERAALGSLSRAVVGGYPALRVTNGKDRFALYRRMDARLLPTPYFSWTWHMGPHGRRGHPVRLLIGFQGGLLGRKDPVHDPADWEDDERPPYDRMLILNWDGTALRRGDLRKKKNGPAFYTVRGGREHAETWWPETIDLAGLYRQSWPLDDESRVRVVFIGIESRSNFPSTTAHLSGLGLSR